MELNGKEYELSPRKAKEILDLQEAFKEGNLEEVANITNVMVMAQTISDSLRATWRNKVMKVFLEKTRLDAQFIFDNIDDLQILYVRVNRFVRWRIKRKISRYNNYLIDYKFVLSMLDQQTFANSFVEVIELEGGKKKVVAGKTIGRDVAKGMIALHFGIPLDKVEEENIIEYRLRLFTIFNNALLKADMSGMFKEKLFKYQTDEEEMSEFKLQIEDAKKRGLL
jgi:hypothetical protein